MKGGRRNQEETLTGEEGLGNEEGGGRRGGLHNKNSNIQRMSSDLTGLQGLFLGWAQECPQVRVLKHFRKPWLLGAYTEVRHAGT